MRINNPQSQSQRQIHVSVQLEKGADQFKNDKIGKCDHTDRSVARIQQHLLVQNNRLHQPAVPAVALALEHPIALGNLRPAVGIEGVEDFVGDALLAQMLMQSDHQLHILAHSGDLHPALCGQVSADFDYAFADKQPECTGDNQHAVQQGPAQPTGQKSAHVFDGLKAGQVVFGQVYTNQPAVAYRAAVGRQNVAAEGDGLAVGHYGLIGDFEQRIVLEQ